MRLGLGPGKNLKQRIGGTFTPTLSTLSLSSATIQENSVAGTVVGTLIGLTGGSTLSITDTAGSKFALSGTQIVAGATATDYETATTHNITIRETLSGAIGTPKDTVIAIAVTDVSEASLNAPVISLTAASPLDISVSWTPPSGESVIGYYFLTQIDNDIAFGSPEQKVLSLIELEDLNDLDDATGLTTPGVGTSYGRVYAVRENEFGATLISGATDEAGNTVSDFYADVSSASNVVTITVASPATEWSSTDGVNKQSLIDVSGTPKLNFLTGADGGGNAQLVRASNQAASSHAGWEFTVTGCDGDTTIGFGIDNGVTNFNTAGQRPGMDNSAGIYCAVGNFASLALTRVSVRHTSNGVNADDATTEVDPLKTGDIYRITVDKATGSGTDTYVIKRKRSGTTVTLKTVTGVPALSAYYPYVGVNDAAAAGTATFNGPYAIALDSGEASNW